PMNKRPILTLEIIQQAIFGPKRAAAFRSSTKLQPAGGVGDKVFPPTYEGGSYARETRRLPDGTDAECVLLDSVQSQANRHELALQDAWEEGRISLPVITVDFAGNDLRKTLRITSLEAPHRIADAIIRDSLHNGEAFRKSSLGRRIDEVDIRNATVLFEMCPTALVFGVWDSTGPKGGLGARFARAMVSEIVGYHARVGVKTGSRIEPAGIRLHAGPLYQAADTSGIEWTLDEEHATTTGSGKRNVPLKLGKDGRPSQANHGNIPPSIATGGVTLSYAVQTTVISLPALRRLRFPLEEGSKSDRKVDQASQVALAALALCAATLTREDGYDLRSRCQLFPSEETFWELLELPGVEPAKYSLTGGDAVKLYSEALNQAKAIGLPYLETELVLQPSPQLVELVRRSQELAKEQGRETE
ncbi:MAG: type I-U CRISPR-associated protein Cas7, partial [Planctomycetaceae bacterium]|nr:type I-U CRISPR-associated protein Cas7 [Planctomycetaceae bacterium]